MNYTTEENLYLWNKADKKIDTITEMANNAQKINDKFVSVDSSLAEKVQLKTVVLEVSKDGKSQFSKIQDAVFAADEIPNPVTILIYPGTYNESVTVGGTRKVSLVGVNKRDCIIQMDTGLYNDAPLEIEGSAYIENLTLKHTHDLAVAGTDINTLQGYAVHCDYTGAGVTEFFNCELISYQNAAAGCGMHQGQRLIFRNCEITSTTPAGAPMLVNGALFVHNAVASGVTGQELIISDCNIQSYADKAIYINDANKTVGDGLGNTMTVSFKRNRLYSTLLGVNGIVGRETPNVAIDKFSGCITFLKDSYGNNIEELNYQTYRPVSVTPTAGTNYGGVYQPLQIGRTITGEIHLKGMLKMSVTTSPQTVYTVPTGWTPKYDLPFVTISNDGTGTVLGAGFIRQNGQVQLTDNIRTGFVYLEARWYPETKV